MVLDFENMVQFLIQCIDPSFTLGDKWQDDVRFAFKTLGYPFNISKTALSAVELIEYDEDVTEAEAENDTAHSLAGCVLCTAIHRTLISHPSKRRIE